MDINQLVYFISVAQTLNFSEAARRNYVSQSTVSRHVSDLEKEFGVQLFSRTRREVFITNEGKTLLPYAIEMVNTFNKARTVIKEMHDGGKGKITIGCDVTSMSFPSKCLSDFGKRYPGISIELCRLDASDRAQAITALITHHEPLVIVAPHKNRFRGKSISLSELADERIVLLSESSAPILFMEVMDLLRTFHLSPRTDSSYDDLASLYMAVSAGMGLSVLPKSLSEFASSARTSVYSVEDADTAVAYVMAWARDIANPVAGLFIDTVRKYAEGEDDIYDL